MDKDDHLTDKISIWKTETIYVFWTPNFLLFLHLTQPKYRIMSDKELEPAPSWIMPRL